MTLPVLIEEGVGPVEAISRSLDLLRRNWGENLIGNGGISVGIAVIAIPIMIVAMFLTFAAVATHATGTIVLAVLFCAFTVVTIGLVSTTLHTIYTAALYRFATGSKENAGIDGELLAGAYRVK
jgi:cobalamin biosynthesis protein CobD/CbiB